MDSLHSLGVLISEAPSERQLRGSRLPELPARHAEVIQHLHGSCHLSHAVSCTALIALMASASPSHAFSGTYDLPRSLFSNTA